jgi:hypothetical protein
MDRISQHPFFFNAAIGLLDRDTIGAIEDNPLTIGHDVWISQSVIIAPGCRSVGDSAVLASGAVVVKDVPSFAIVGGIPAKIIGWRLPEELRTEWLRSEWWQKPICDIADQYSIFTRPFCSTSAVLSPARSVDPRRSESSLNEQTMRSTPVTSSSYHESSKTTANPI